MVRLVRFLCRPAVQLARTLVVVAGCAAVAGLCPLAVADQSGHALADVPYSAPVVQVLNHAREAVEGGNAEEARRLLHGLLKHASPAFTVEKLELHRQVARAFVELGFRDDALRTLRAAAADARAVGLHDIARALDLDYEATYTGAVGRAAGVQQAGWFDRLFGGRHDAHHDHPYRPDHGALVIPPTVTDAPLAPVESPVTGPHPVVPGDTHTGGHTPHLHPHGQAYSQTMTMPAPHAHQHSHGAYHPVHSPGLWAKFRHWLHSWKPRAAVTRDQLAPRPVPPPALPQYPTAVCENCQKRGRYPSVANPPAPPLGTVPGISPPVPAVPLSPYSGHHHSLHGHAVQPHVQPPQPERVGLLDRVGNWFKRPFGWFRRRPVEAQHDHVTPGWPVHDARIGAEPSPLLPPR